MILAGDVGGTKVHLALYNFVGGRLAEVRDHKFPAHEFATLDDVVKAFQAQGKDEPEVVAACGSTVGMAVIVPPAAATVPAAVSAAAVAIG